MRPALAAALLVAAAGCGGAEVATEAPRAEPRAAAPEVPDPPASPNELEVRVIDLPGDGRVVPIGIGRDGESAVYLALGPEGLQRMDVEPDGAVATSPLAIDVRPVRALYEDGQLWWMSARTRQLMPSASDRMSGGPVVLTTSHTIGIGDGVRRELALCPEPDVIGGGVSCDHPLRAAVATADALFVGGGLTPALGQQPHRGYAGRIDRSGTIAARVTLEQEGIVQSLVPGAERVLAIGVSREREGGRPWTVVLDASDMSAGVVAHARPASVSRPWGVGVAHDDGFWVVLSYTRWELTFLDLAPDGAVRSQRPLRLPAPELSFQSTRTLVGTRDGLFLVVAESSFGDRGATLRVFRIDAARAEITDERRAPLPDETWVHDFYAWPGGVLLAARVGVERPALLIVEASTFPPSPSLRF